MKKIINAVIQFLIQEPFVRMKIWKFLFAKKKKSATKETTEVQWTNNTTVPKHNNRKRTRGRHIKIVPTGRVIYQGAK